MGRVRWSYHNAPPVGEVSFHVKRLTSVVIHGALECFSESLFGIQCRDQASVMLVYHGKSWLIGSQPHATMWLPLRRNPLV
jgi:hypothetical protein